VTNPATLGNPGKHTFCFAEDESGSPWESLSVERGFDPGASTVRLFTGNGVQPQMGNRIQKAAKLKIT